MRGIVALCLLATAALAHAGPRYGIWDPGFTAAVVRTPYAHPLDGTAPRPLTLEECRWDKSITGCPSGPSAYKRAHYWTQNARNCRVHGACGADAFWIFQANNEPAFDACNPGPPNASLPRAKPGRGLMGFTAARGAKDRRYRAHLVLDLDHANPCDGGYGIPFMGIALDRDRGNRGLTPAALNASARSVPDVVEFTARLHKVALPACAPDVCDGADYFVRAGRGTVDFAFWAVAEWGGARRMLFVDLAHFNRQYHGGRAGTIYEWNWPAREDFLAGGADIAFLEAEDLPALCGYELPALDAKPYRDVAYRVDLQRVFACASALGLFRDALPADADVPVTTLGWKVEGFGTSGGIWASVHGMRTVSATARERTARAPRETTAPR